MINTEKQLLLKDLCARLPYGVKIKYLYWDEDKGCEYPVPMVLDDINSDGYIRFHGDIAEGEGRGMLTQYLPYLRSMSSMTEKEQEAYCDLQDKFLYSSQHPVTGAYELFDWLNARHFDYRGLIEKGLALEAPEDMYKEEQL